MKNLITNVFLRTFLKFVQENKWVPFLYAFILILLLIYRPENASFFKIFSAFITSGMHLTADIFILMMIDSYSINDRKYGSVYQFIAMAIFTASKLFSGVAENNWLYISTDPAYVVSAFKNYYKDVLGGNFFIDKLWKFIIVSSLCFIGFILLNRPVGISKAIFAIGLLLFAVGLFCGENKQLSNILMIAGLSINVLMSGYIITGIFRDELPTGLDISHFILPLTVLLYKLKTVANNHPIN